MSDFHKRFNIDVGEDEARARFRKRLETQIFHLTLDEVGLGRETRARFFYRLGEDFDGHHKLPAYLNDDLNRTLIGTEGVVEAIAENLPTSAEKASKRIEECIADCEVDIGIRWKDGKFYPKGAEELDEALVNKNLAWLRGAGLDTVLKPFEKGLEHLLTKRFGDAVTDMYESVEALAKIVCKNDRDLSQNAEQFVSRLKAPEPCKKMLKEYIGFGCSFRHAESPDGVRRPSISETEAEWFVYQTGLFLRLAIPR